MNKKFIGIALVMLSIEGCENPLTSLDVTTLEIELTCKSRKTDALKPDFYVDEDFVGSINVDCDGYADRFYVKLKPGVHNIVISIEDITRYSKDINILGTDKRQKIAVDIP